MAAIQNTEIAEKFNHLADLLEIEGANRFRVRAYRNAARTLLGLSENVQELLQQQEDLSELPGIGKDLATKIKEIVDTGHLSLLDQIEKETPGELSELLKIQSLGPKRVAQLYHQSQVTNLSDLKDLVESKKILELPGFGEKTRNEILEQIRKIDRKDRPRLKLNEAQEAAHIVLKHLQKAPLQRVSVAGSLRRQQETIGDLDILVTAENGDKVMDHFLKLESITKIISHGKTKSSVLLRSGIQTDLRVVPDSSYGAALLYLTGSKSHNIALRSLAVKKGLKLNEYGIFKGNKKIASENEEDIYKVLGLTYIEPELRENRGEIKAAFEGHLPQLVCLKDIRGDLHVHTKESDGSNSIEEIVQAAQKLGYAYIAITDHSKHLAVAHGLDSERLLRQIEKINGLNKKLKGLTILKSIEVDILEDGRLDLPDEVLKKLDFTVCAIHSNFHLSQKKQTERILQAMKNPYFNILAHPTTRLIESRPPINVDWEQIIRAARDLKKVLEINAQPERMDLPDVFCRSAKASHVKMVISTDAHNTLQLGYMKYGVGQARRGWLEKTDLINTLSLGELKKRLHE